MTKIISSNLGYPRIGEKREWKQALEQYWDHSISEKELLDKTKKLRLENLKKQQDLGIDLIPVGDFSLYDHVLDTSVMFGVIPNRFDYHGGKVSLDTYFAMARGVKHAVASEMTKWFNTNYHYIVPELESIKPTVTENLPLTYYKEAKQELGIDGKPVILGPITYLKLSKGYEEKDFGHLLHAFLPLYIQVFKELEEAGVTWVQLDEPIFGTNLSEEILANTRQAYEAIQDEVPNLNIIIQTYFESVVQYKEVVDLPVKGIGLDFVHGESLSLIQEYGFPKDKVLAAGVINGRNVWRADLENNLQLLADIKQTVESDRLIVQPSSSLLHVPVTKEQEEDLDVTIKGGLSFADEKLVEVVTLTEGLKNGKQSVNEELQKSKQELERLRNSTLRTNKEVKANIENLNEDDIKRSVPFNQRIKKQQEHFHLPLLPTTTIGSLPQTTEVKKTRTAWRKKQITTNEYEQFVRDYIKKWIGIQEELGLDVLVHGEPERADMVEYFGEKLNGFTVTKYGWVQSYGSRCVKPPLIVGDVYFDQPMTVKEAVYAQSLTDKPVKGMLTGPTTIYNWSFVHNDVPRKTVLNQIGLALRKEIEALEENWIKIIQVDEPALREGLPLDRNKWQDYLEDAVYAFKLATASVKDDTQIHTHMCYSDFQDIFDTIDALDADVISIETSRSHGELISTFEENTYNKEIGLGVYDIHSPRIPSKEEIKQNINRALKTISSKQFWINPDCGLKTRKEEETIEALKTMVEAAREIREELLTYQK
ncbi:5-methyltetrahydropteroyltriglutamate--homocysteine S-methyltransferase [Aquibacillus albus]|uniref:5-methyltetrahydropteroyltriglutamate--homocysteine methyltransferase n=1 Tax=Aquibacillus albus TaxID=1168171 RepID=A0ABS2MY02_9BACI|nr:5-methyltetrahydropteroyltriglutamate--homocysteine S-methyltransferase [Aquibacillus albus]MBM7570767.1 5-methyltetrahydropteroyltriglutamate--homocysteine methyltransferase [Aquibacillus albus]